MKRLEEKEEKNNNNEEFSPESLQGIPLETEYLTD